MITWMRWDAAMLARNFEAAEQVAAGFAGETLPSVGGAPMWKGYLQGVAAWPAARLSAGVPYCKPRGCRWKLTCKRLR